ncbi:hypothetical protein [Mycoplasmopsis phocirhinis]|uniref:hypothetical protein n=1 Tax=Mycoplasmopsis phocirhinis TaxID=142650 RepID=UPI0013EE7867|nr:hypothetical protein [Mycoplasmopsis phocirhinis]
MKTVAAGYTFNQMLDAKIENLFKNKPDWDEQDKKILKSILKELEDIRLNIRQTIEF